MMITNGVDQLSCFDLMYFERYLSNTFVLIQFVHRPSFLFSNFVSIIHYTLYINNKFGKKKQSLYAIYIICAMS